MTHNMTSVSIDHSKQQATVEVGQRLAGLHLALVPFGYDLPTGLCPTVGLGQALGGGFGVASRYWGFLIDHIVGIELVDPFGDIKTITGASTGNDALLWWALRGAGGNNFGVVTSITFAVRKVPKSTVNFQYAFKTLDDCANVLHIYSRLASLLPGDTDALPSELGIDLGLTGLPSSACSVIGQYYGSMSDFNLTIAKFMSKLKAANVHPAKASVRAFDDWLAALNETTAMDGYLNAPIRQESYYGQSLVDNGTFDLSLNDAKMIMNAVSASQLADGSYKNVVEVAMLGPTSATNRPPPTGDMAFSHRNSIVLINNQGLFFPDKDLDIRSKALVTMTKTTGNFRSANPGGTWGAYQNFMDPYLTNWAESYYGSNLPLLRKIKKEVDPHNVFDFPQGLAHA